MNVKLNYFFSINLYCNLLLKMQFNPTDPWFYNRCYLDALSSWPGRTPEEIRSQLPKYVLMLATLQGDLFQIQRILVSHVANINDTVPEWPGTPIWYAVQRNDPELVDYLLDFGPDLTIVNPEYETNAHQLAISKGNKKIIDMIEAKLKKKK